MFRPLFAALALASLTLTAAPLAAQEMTDAERAAFRAEVRAYLLEHPEVLMEAIGVLEQREDAAKAEADQQMLAMNMDALLNDPYSFVGGNPDGDITLIEFMDYRCGYCKRAFPEVAELIESDGNLRYIVKEFPILGEQSVLASQFAVATMLTNGDEAYESVHNALMQYNGDITPVALTRLAEGLGLDPAPITDMMNSDEVLQIIGETRALGQRLAINGTPTFIVQDELLRGYVPLAQMQAIVADLRG